MTRHSKASKDRKPPEFRSLLGQGKQPRLSAGPAIMKSGSSGEQVCDFQARLKQIGWFAGPVTGTYGSVTTKSVKGFQAKRRIPETGEVDQRTLDRLRTEYDGWTGAKCWSEGLESEQGP